MKATCLRAQLVAVVQVPGDGNRNWRARREAGTVLEPQRHRALGEVSRSQIRAQSVLHVAPGLISRQVQRRKHRARRDAKPGWRPSQSPINVILLSEPALVAEPQRMSRLRLDPAGAIRT